MAEKSTREKVAEMYAAGEGATVLEIARALGISPQAVYYHLDKLKAVAP